jgi:hypothetical protein
MSLEFPVEAGGARSWLARWAKGRVTGALLVAGDLDARIRAVAGYFYGAPGGLALAAGGPAASDDDLLAGFEALKGVARRLARDVTHAFISVEPTFAGFASPFHDTEWSRRHGGAPFEMVRGSCDEFLFDAFPYQVLAPGHLARLDSAPAGGRELGGGRVELEIGEPAAWLFDRTPDQESIWRLRLAEFRRDPKVQEQAREALRPCLFTSESSAAR